MPDQEDEGSEDEDEDEDANEGSDLDVEEQNASSGEEESDDPLATSEDEDGEEDDEDDVDADEQSEDGIEDQSSTDSDSEEETQAEKNRKAAYFASPDDPSASSQKDHSSFTTMSLSRPLLKALTAMGFSTPTPIQASTIPVALLGKDVVGNAVTGSGKTAAFVIPVLERLMYRERGKGKAAVRCVVLVPTRELGVQCADVAKKLAVYMDVRIALIVGMTYSRITSRTTAC